MNKLTIKTKFKVNQSSSGGYGYVTHFEESKNFNSIEEAEELNYYDVKGALLSYDGSKYTIWNGEEDLDSRAWDYREDRSAYVSGTADVEDNSGNLLATGLNEDVVYPENSYGEVIAVCVGNGLWMSTKWDPNNNGLDYQWCTENSPLNNIQKDCIQGTGWENTSKLVQRCQEGDLFAYVRDFGTDDGTQGHWYVPSIFEIFQAICNLGNVTDSNKRSFLNNISNAVHQLRGFYWSSSQAPEGIETASELYDAFDSYYRTKSEIGDYCCTVLLHFGEALY